MGLGAPNFGSIQLIERWNRVAVSERKNFSPRLGFMSLTINFRFDTKTVRTKQPVDVGTPPQQLLEAFRRQIENNTHIYIYHNNHNNWKPAK